MKKKSQLPKATHDGLVLELTGEQEDGHHVVKVSGSSVGLAQQPFAALCVLAAARLTDSSHAAAVSKWTVSRLRRSFDRQTRRGGLGEQLIWPSTKGKYVLGIPPERIKVAASFRDLLLTDAVDRAVVARLLEFADDKQGR